MNNRMIYTLKAPAKINIGLRIISKRKDGFHNIETIFYPIKLYDIVRLKISKVRKPGRNGSVNVTTDSPELKNERKNICHKAVELFFKKFRVTGKYKINIHIKKNIPIGAGLGGGSSDAGAVLTLLCRHFKIKPESINDLAKQVGSDVPFFVKRQTSKVKRKQYFHAAYGAGRGEELIYLPEFRITYLILVVYAGIRISTRWAYRKLKVESSKLKVLNKVKTFSTKVTNLFDNDFEEVVLKKYPAIKQIKNKMYECGGMFSSMSGSGSAVYGIFKDLNGLGKCKRHFERKGYKVYNV